MRKGLLPCPAAAHPGDWCAGEVQRVALEIEYHLHYIRVHDVGRSSDGDGESGDLNRGVIQKNFDGGIHGGGVDQRSEEHTSELQSRLHLVCRLLLEKKKQIAPREKAVAIQRGLRSYSDDH